MENSVNMSVSIADDTDLEQTSSFLNQNVSFNSSFDNTLPAAGIESIPNVSFTLSNSECQKLKECMASNGASTANGSVHINPICNNNNNNNTQNNSRMEDSVDLDEDSTMEESEAVISIDDTVEELSKDGHSKREISPTRTVIPMPTYFEDQLVELGRRLWPSSAGKQHYTKGCYWSPDGTCLLVPVHQDGMHVIELPTDLYGAKSVSTERDVSAMQSAVHVPEGGTVYDCAWYPLMSSHDPDSCFWLATRQHEPINMWDAFDGRLRCSYSGYDEVDEVVSAISLGFSHDGQQIFAGYKRCIKIFDTCRPGRIYNQYPVKFAISCIAQTTEHPHTVTCGNWKGYIQHFDLRSPPNQGPLFTLGGHTAGITQLRYVENGASNWQLFSGARKCPKLFQWDMRNYRQPLREFQRQVNTNQRIQFDVNPARNWLASGSTDGTVNLWDLQEEQQDVSSSDPDIQVQLHEDCCNGLSFHPTLPILASSSGQYHFISGDTHDCTVDTTDSDPVDTELEHTTSITYENAVLLLWCADT